MPPNPLESAVRIGGLVLINAMVFQEELAAQEPRVRTLARVGSGGGDERQGFLDAWEQILTINYVPIYRVARELLLNLPASADLNDGLRGLAVQATAIVSRRGALRHDLMGRIYHRLLHEAKYLGTYYTSVPAATLLAKLAYDPRKWPVDWADLAQVEDFRAADPACGTGTLLMASVQAITDNYVSARAATAQPVDLTLLHQVLVESTLWGYDVLTSAVHLTASTLALLAPAVSFHHMNLQVLPLGGAQRRLGSVEFLESRTLAVQQDLFGTADEAMQVGGGGDAVVAAELPELDLCIMNPPFTRSVGGSLLFGSLPEAERRRMQSRLRTMLRARNVQANSTAGLAPVFVAVADRVVKLGGRQALVTPRALTTGVAWGETRNLLMSRYETEHIIASHEPGRWNFSENTSLSEVLLVAKRVDQPSQAARTIWVNLWRNPKTMVEAAALAEAIRTTEPASLENPGVARLEPDETAWGEIFSTPLGWLGADLWIYQAFAQTELARFAHRLLVAAEVAPPGDRAVPVPLARFDELGTIGPDRRDVHDAFTTSSTPTAYPAVWGHSANAVRTICKEIDLYLNPRATAAAGRPLRRADLLWPRSGQLLLAERLRLNTRRISCAWAPQPVLSNVWWPFHVTADEPAAVAKVLALWMNSTLGLATLLARREETEGAWVAFKKPVLAATRVLDPRRLDAAQLATLSAEFDRLCESELEPFTALATDTTRIEIDDALSRVLGLPALASVRALLAQEPVMSQRPLG